MIGRSTLRATLIASAAFMLLARGVVADTCCANVPVGLEPRSAGPGDVVRLIGMQCRNADNSGPLPLGLGSFYLATTDRAAESDPDTAPGPGLPAELPPMERWLPFASVPGASQTIGDATIEVPVLSRGTYQLWWWCDDGSGPGGGIHYSTGPRLVITGSPDTDTATIGSHPSRSPDWPLGLGIGLVVGVVTLVSALRWGPFRATRGSTEGPR